MKVTCRIVAWVFWGLFISLTGCKHPVKNSTLAPAAPAQPLQLAGPKSELPSTNYDRAMIKAIQVRWYQLLDAKGYGGGVKGRMVFEFTIHSDGNVSDIGVLESNLQPAFAELCQAAIKDVSPFPPWPAELRDQIGRDERVVKFAFNF